MILPAWLEPTAPSQRRPPHEVRASRFRFGARAPKRPKPGPDWVQASKEKTDTHTLAHVRGLLHDQGSGRGSPEERVGVKRPSSKRTDQAKLMHKFRFRFKDEQAKFGSTQAKDEGEFDFGEAKPRKGVRRSVGRGSTMQRTCHLPNAWNHEARTARHDSGVRIFAGTAARGTDTAVTGPTRVPEAATPTAGTGRSLAARGGSRGTCVDTTGDARPPAARGSPP